METRLPKKDQTSYRETCYGFPEDPFALNPDPKFLFSGPTHSEALSSMLSGIKEKRGIIVITGEAGVGKTLLVYTLLKDRGEKIRMAFIFNPILDLKSILENIFLELGLPIQERGENIFSLLVGFRKILKESLKQDETVAIVIDEAQSLEEEVLEGLFRLATPDSPGTNALQILLVGHPDLEKKLNSERFNSFRARIAIKWRIPPLSRVESRDYISYRLNLIGRNIVELFTPDSVKKIIEYSKGNPRVINLLCGRALSTGYQACSPIIDSKIVHQAIKELKYLRIKKTKTPPVFFRLTQKIPPGTIRILFFALSAGVFLLSLGKIFSLLLEK